MPYQYIYVKNEMTKDTPPKAVINNQAKNAKRDWRCKHKAKADLNRMKETNNTVDLISAFYSMQQRQKLQEAALSCYGGRVEVYLFVKVASAQADESFQRLEKAKWLFSLAPGDSSWIREGLNHC